MRKYYIDNLRWLTLLILIPYHTAMAWNVWDEPNYIFFEKNKLISSIVVFLSPYFMPLLFLLAGISTKYALQKRTHREYFRERVHKLLIPLLFGTAVLMPILCYLGDKFNCGYKGGFLSHYVVFFTKYTDLTGADGGFSFGQFWFLLYLLIISIASIGTLKLLKIIPVKSEKTIPFPVVLLLGLPLPLLSEWLSIGGKSFAEYMYLFLIGYFVFTDEKIIKVAEKHCFLLFCTGLTAAFLDVYLFIWTDKEYAALNTFAKFMAEWLMIIALIGFSKKCLNFSSKVSSYMKTRSFLFYIYHFIWVVLFQYLLYSFIGNNTAVLFIGTLLLAYPATFICCEISVRIPVLCFLTGIMNMNQKVHVDNISPSTKAD